MLEKRYLKICLKSIFYYINSIKNFQKSIENVRLNQYEHKEIITKQITLFLENQLTVLKQLQTTFNEYITNIKKEAGSLKVKVLQADVLKIFKIINEMREKVYKINF